MGFEYKAVQVAGVTQHTDDENGIVTAIVSVTGLKDNVNDIINPGAYTETLTTRKPKCVWQHKWEEPVGKTVEAKELMPGDPQLPKQLPNGEPWPENAGGLLVKTQFNIDSERGKQAYSDVKFFGDEQEWSIGYRVPPNGATMDTKSATPTRNIHKLDLYEYSPVLFGAMPAARTASVKDAQLAYKSLFTDEVDDDDNLLFKSVDRADDDGDEEEEDFEDEYDEDNDEEDGKSDDDDLDFKSAVEDILNNGDDLELDDMTQDQLKQAINTLTRLAAKKGNIDTPMKSDDLVYIEVKATGYTTLAEAVDDVPNVGRRLVREAKQFDNALNDGDREAAEEYADSITGLLSDIIGKTDDVDTELASRVALRVMLDQGDVEGEDDEEKSLWIDVESKSEYVAMDTKGRKHGALYISGQPAHDVRAHVGTLDDDELKTLGRTANHYGDYNVGRMVADEQASRAELKKMFSTKKRADLAKTGAAMPDGSYPIENENDLKNAVRAIGRANPSDRDAVKAHIKKRAKALGAGNVVPDDWDSDNDEKSENTEIERKSMFDGLAELEDLLNS